MPVPGGSDVCQGAMASKACVDSEARNAMAPVLDRPSIPSVFMTTPAAVSLGVKEEGSVVTDVQEELLKTQCQIP